MATSLQFALSNPTPGMEEEFNRWYSGPHFTHTLEVPGILAGQRFRRAENGPWPAGRHDYLTIWELDDPRFALEQLALVRGGEKMPLSPAVDMSTVQPPTMWLRAGVRNARRIATDTSSRKSVVLALINPAAGEGPALECAMISGALVELADLPGVLAADFLTLADEQIRGSARKYAYSLLIELADEAAGLAALAGPMCRLPHADPEKWIAPVFRPLGARGLAAGAARATAS
jgi:hypothetical protein